MSVIKLCRNFLKSSVSSLCICGDFNPFGMLLQKWKGLRVEDVRHPGVPTFACGSCCHTWDRAKFLSQRCGRTASSSPSEYEHHWKAPINSRVMLFNTFIYTYVFEHYLSLIVCTLTMACFLYFTACISFTMVFYSLLRPLVCFTLHFKLIHWYNTVVPYCKSFLLVFHDLCCWPLGQVTFEIEFDLTDFLKNNWLDEVCMQYVRAADLKLRIMTKLLTCDLHPLSSESLLEEVKKLQRHQSAGTHHSKSYG